eukprot:TRINITY_DN117128_c0_g1_i1.p1 TRINITY_DN117128_c0_g1~~TRINITY_DN117128_c0_g1_i1.p1  ORF type:complete len:357 (-),score=53.94 TRINITY_DN117128_c0_g1_i1:45-1115(-)
MSLPRGSASDAHTCEAEDAIGTHQAGMVGPGSAHDLWDGPFCDVAAMLDVTSLCQLDASCRDAKSQTQHDGGAWFRRGFVDFRGFRLYHGEPDVWGMSGGHVSCGGSSSSKGSSCSGSRAERELGTDWKSQYRRFRTSTRTFNEPFAGSELTTTAQSPEEEAAYLMCSLRGDVLSYGDNGGVYIQVEVTRCPGSLSISLVDFEADVVSSVTFSPENGAVLCERQGREAPEELDGVFAQPLQSLPVDMSLRGMVALYVENGHLAFLRRVPLRSFADASGEAGMEEVAAEDWADWECTGFVCDLAWASSGCLRPCLGFSDAGGKAYQVRVVEVSNRRPEALDRFSSRALANISWHPLR